MKTQKETTTHKENLARLSRIEGQVRGIRRMIEEEEYCIDIITQLQAVQSAVAAVSRQILQKHLDNCVRDTLQSKSKVQVEKKMQELGRVMKRMCR